jgi:hypothetical protein
VIGSIGVIVARVADAIAPDRAWHLILNIGAIPKSNSAYRRPARPNTARRAGSRASLRIAFFKSIFSF